jgi:hypothetical protein
MDHLLDNCAHCFVECFDVQDSIKGRIERQASCLAVRVQGIKNRSATGRRLAQEFTEKASSCCSKGGRRGDIHNSIVMDVLNTSRFHLFAQCLDDLGWLKSIEPKPCAKCCRRLPARSQSRVNGHLFVPSRNKVNKSIQIQLSRTHHFLV